MLRRLTRITLLLALSAVLACGDDGGGGDRDGGSGQDSGNGGQDGGNGGQDGGTDTPQSCDPAFGAETACGGDLNGTWDVVETCSDFDYTTLIADQCADATQTSATYDLTGTLVVAGGNFAYEITGDVTVEANIPGGCKVGSCANTATILGVFVDSAVCVNGAGGSCDCTLVVSGADSSSGSYTASNGIAVVDTGDEWYYCSGPGDLLLREKLDTTDEPNPTYLLSKQ